MRLISHIISLRPTSDFSLHFGEQLGTTDSVNLMDGSLCFSALGTSPLVPAQLTKDVSWSGGELTPSGGRNSP